MLLAIDVGNTNLTLGLFQGEILKHTFRLARRASATSDEYAMALRSVLELKAIAPEYVEAVIVVSVVPALTATIAAAVKLSFGVPARVVGADVAVEMPVLCDDPEQVGADRKVNALAAREIFSGSNEGVSNGIVVVDFGTATTFDCVSPAGEFLGGVIAPGLVSSHLGLIDRAAQLHEVPLTPPPGVLARNTRHALQAGVLVGHACLVDGLLARLQTEMGGACQIVATGGLAPLVVEQSRTLEKVEANLTLLGLRGLFERSLAR